MRNIFLMVLVVLITLASCNQKPKTTVEQKDTVAVTKSLVVPEDNRLDTLIQAFIKAYSDKNSDEVNRLIHPDLGLTVIYRPGVADVFTKIQEFDFAKPIPAHFAYPDVKGNFELAYAALPVFDCGTEKWSKQGLYCDTTVHPNQLTKIVAFEKEFEPKKYTKSQVHEIEVSENESFRVILTGWEPLVFHVQYYQGQWYVTVLDRAYAGCDA